MSITIKEKRRLELELSAGRILLPPQACSLLLSFVLFFHHATFLLAIFGAVSLGIMLMMRFDSSIGHPGANEILMTCNRCLSACLSLFPLSVYQDKNSND